MNIHALTLAAAIAAASFGAQASSIRTLDTVQVRPSTAQIAQHEHELASDIPTLAAVQVRPSAEQLAQYEAELAASQRIVTLATVNVRPSAEQLAERDGTRVATASDAHDHTLMAAAAALLGTTIITLPVLHVSPGASDLKALADAAAHLTGVR